MNENTYNLRRKKDRLNYINKFIKYFNSSIFNEFLNLPQLYNFIKVYGDDSLYVNKIMVLLICLG